MAVKTGTIGASGIVTSSVTDFGTKFNISLSGFGSATIALERSWDKGSTWPDVIESFTADTVKRGDSHEGAMYRLNATAWASGTITYRISG